MNVHKNARLTPQGRAFWSGGSRGGLAGGRRGGGGRVSPNDSA